MCCSLGRGMIDRFKADGVEWSGGQVTAQDDLFFPKLTRTADKTLFPVFTHPSCLFQVYARAQPAPSDSVWGWCITAHWHWCVPGGSGAEDKGRAARATKCQKRQAGANVRHPTWAQLHSGGEFLSGRNWVKPASGRKGSSFL